MITVFFICSLKSNIENLPSHILQELELAFSIIAITETRITNAKLTQLNFNYNIPGYVFEFLPTPLSAGGVGMYIREDYNYHVIEKYSCEDFQSLFVEIITPNKKKIICGVLYRQHNHPDSFLKYFYD